MDVSITPRLFGASVELQYQQPRPFNPLELGEFASSVAGVLEFPVRAEMFTLRHGDAFLGYTLTGHFLGDNVQVVRTSERVGLTLRNGRTQDDLQFISRKAQSFIDLFVGSMPQLVITAFCHGECENASTRQKYLNRFAIENHVIEGPGATGRVRSSPWPALVKVFIEASFLVPTGLFVSCETAVSTLDLVKDKLEAGIVASASQAFESASAAFGLHLMAAA